MVLSLSFCVCVYVCVYTEKKIKSTVEEYIWQTGQSRWRMHTMFIVLFYFVQKIFIMKRWFKKWEKWGKYDNLEHDDQRGLGQQNSNNLRTWKEVRWTKRITSIQLTIILILSPNSPLCTWRKMGQNYLLCMEHMLNWKCTELLSLLSTQRRQKRTNNIN